MSDDRFDCYRGKTPSFVYNSHIVAHYWEMAWRCLEGERIGLGAKHFGHKAMMEDYYGRIMFWNG